MVAIKLHKLLSLRSTSTSINSGNDMNQYDIDDENDDIKEAHNDLAASIANHELLLTAAAMKHTNNSSSEDSIRVLSYEIKMLRDEMRERFDVLEKKFNNCDNSDNNVDVSMDSKSVYKDKGGVLSSPVLSVEKDLGELLSPANIMEAEKDTKAKDETEVIRSHQNKDKVVDDKVVGKDVKSINIVDELLEEDTAEDAVWGEEKLHVDIVNDKQQDETLITPQPTRVLKRVKRNKSRKQQAKGKRRQKKRNKIESPASSSTSIIPTAGYNGILINLVALINAIAALLLMRGGKRLYMLLAFISASYLFKEEMNSFSDTSAVDDIKSSGDWFSIGSFSFIQGVRALEDCPDQYIGTDIDSYSIGSKVKIEEKVYECTESPCGWRIIGTCVGDMFLSSSASAQPTIQTLGMPVHFPSMMPSALDTDKESNLIESIADSVPIEPSLERLRTHSIQEETRQGLFGDDDDESTQAALYYPDYVLAKCVTESSTIFDSNQASASIEECCDQW